MNRLPSLARAAAPLASRVMGAAPAVAPAGAMAAAAEAAAAAGDAAVCGRGDKRTAKGKRFKHSNGKCRPRSPSRRQPLSTLRPAPAPPAPPL